MPVVEVLEVVDVDVQARDLTAVREPRVDLVRDAQIARQPRERIERAQLGRAAQGGRDTGHQLVDVERLRHEVVGAVPKARGHLGGGPLRRDEDDRDVPRAPVAAELAMHVVAGQERHGDVQDDQVGPRPARLLECRLAVRGEDAVVARLLEGQIDQGPSRRVVVRD